MVLYVCSSVLLWPDGVFVLRMHTSYACSSTVVHGTNPVLATYHMRPHMLSWRIRGANVASRYLGDNEQPTVGVNHSLDSTIFHVCDQTL
jgi:hypothetical protein